ncbi:D-2-hydroxyacid dehydrogenase [Bradyrhizobium hipponense]|uniref:D-2-hydroxyacid dehydrogenase n=1 Tax=Bradyrhizobium hipponense TaxID=2605638 RepID=A0A5S4YKI0_9BRAD|nr:D-2-hydroxyacid dehydrogenase [Bradyrhizobium hipponense]TYO60829.1 D-2-hydroxyacid dehydrogenase [Bradyrhizobium hipponense]
MAERGERNRYRLIDVYRADGSRLRLLIHHPKCREHVEVIRRHLRVEDVTGYQLHDETLSDVDVLFAFQCPDEVLARLTSLKWIQSTGTGIDAFLGHCRKNPGIMVTAAKGFAAETAASVVLMATLAFHWNLLGRLRDQQKHHWEPHTNYTLEPLISTRTMGVVGLGQIGMTIAGHAKQLGMRVVGTKRQATQIANVDVVYPPEELNRLLGESDFVALVVPLVATTRLLFGAAQFNAMKRTAVLINVARGEVVDETALLSALREGTIAGAALDVFSVEPLPPDSPFWSAPNTLITPHIGGNRIDTYDASATLLANNLKVYPDQRQMRGLCDIGLGY